MFNNEANHVGPVWSGLNPQLLGTCRVLTVVVYTLCTRKGIALIYQTCTMALDDGLGMTGHGRTTDTPTDDWSRDSHLAFSRTSLDREGSNDMQ